MLGDMPVDATLEADLRASLVTKELAESLPVATSSEPIRDRIVRLFSETRLREERPPKYGFSDADECTRKQVYAFREFKMYGSLSPGYGPARWNLAAALGTAMGDFFEAAARRLGDETQAPTTLPGTEEPIAGHADWVTPTHVVDFKRADDATWREVQAQPKTQHRLQANGYAVALGKPKWGILYVRNVTKGEEIPWVFHEGDASPALAEQIVEHWREVEAHRKAGTLPDRPYAQESFECRICKYAITCWRNP